MKKATLLTLGFILTVQIGAFLTEKVKQLVAEKLHYRSTYVPCWGRSRYLSLEMDRAYDSARSLFANDEAIFKKSMERKLLMKISEKNHAMIELSGIVFTFLVSAAGLTLFFMRRRKGKAMEAIDWLGILMGLFFMREIVFDALDLYLKTISCDEANLWHYFNLPVFPSITVFVILGIILFLYILYKIPRDSRILFLGCGFIGTSLGVYLWLVYVSRILLM